IFCWGDVAYRLLARPWLPPARALRIGLAWVFGCGLVSWAVFIGLWAGLSLTAAVTVLSVAGGVLWLLSAVLDRRTSHTPALALAAGSSVQTASETSPWTVVFALVILIQIGLVALAAWASPLTDWDAWLNWASKANVIFIDQRLSAGAYNDPARLPTNLDYPLLLPLVEAWFYTWLGRIHEPVIGLISWLFYGSLLLLFYQAARELGPPPVALGFTALLATVPRLERMGHNGMADVPLAALVLSAFLLLHYDRSRRSPSGLSRRIVALALAAGLMPWLKTEGWLWLALAGAVWLIGLGRDVRGNRLGGGQALAALAVYGGVALALGGAWQLFLAVQGTQRFTFFPLTPATFAANAWRLPWIAGAMLRRLLNPFWNFIWLFAGLTLLARRGRALTGPAGWLIVPVAGYVIGVSLSFVFSRFDPYLAHLNNSAERLVLQAAPLALWWLLGQAVAVGWVPNSRLEVQP
ncbi:MAG: hypothetical protein ACE5H9_08275, partial [Anaerolineae bacterium]